MLNSILETKPDKEMIAGESEWMDCSANQEENFGTGKFNTETAKESRNNTDRTGWEDEREYAFGRKTDEQSVGETEEEMDSDILWNNDRSSSYISDSLYFAGNLFKLINNQTKIS